MKRFKEWLSESEKPYKSPMSIGALFSGDREYEQGFHDAVNDKPMQYHDGGHSPMQATLIGAYLWGWLDAGGDTKGINPLMWMRIDDLTMNTPNGKVTGRHKPPHWTDEQIAASELWDQHRMKSLRQKHYGH